MSKRARVSLSAVKYYQREGLLPEGVRTAPNQVRYSDTHVQRVRLIRALLETGGLSVAATKDVIAALDSDEASLVETFRVAQHAMSHSRAAGSDPTEEARARIRGIAEDQGWCATTDNPGIDAAARALDGLAAIGFEAPDAYLGAYAAAAESSAVADVEALTQCGGRDAVAELMVVGTVLGDPLFAGLRRLAQQHASQGFVLDSEMNRDKQ